MTLVALRIVSSVACVTRINHEIHFSCQAQCLLPMGASYSSLSHGTLVPMPLALLSILTPGVPMEEFTHNDLLRSPFCYSSLTFRECVPTQLSPVNASTMGLSYWITRSKSTMEIMSRAGFSHVRSSLATLFVTMSRLKKNLMENLSQTTQWLLHHDHLLPSGRWRGTGSVSGELEGKVVAIVWLVSPSLGGRFSFFRQYLFLFDVEVLKRGVPLSRHLECCCMEWTKSCVSCTSVASWTLFTVSCLLICLSFGGFWL